nr:unnamed protein product [Naegleria fowleri]
MASPLGITITRGMMVLMLMMMILLSASSLLAKSLSREQIKRSVFMKGRSLNDEEGYLKRMAEHPIYSKQPVSIEGKGPVMSMDQNPFAHSGFFTVNKTVGGQMYYVFFEAQDGNPNAPIILWLQGGPGCSSATGMLIELGPYRINKKTLELYPNPNTWNKHYHLLFVDNPLGAGFSHMQNPQGYIHNEEQMANELYSLLTQFFEMYKQYQPNPFYVFGESYAGKYVPSISYKIANEGFKINLRGFGIGDGLTHSLVQMTNYDQYAYSLGLIDSKQQLEIQKLQDNVKSLILQERWFEATHAWDSIMSALNNFTGGINVYDVREYGDYDFNYFLAFLNLPSTKTLMHTVGIQYNDCDAQAYSALYADMSKSVKYKVESLLNRGVRGILYNGQVDLIINMVQTKWIEEMNWKFSSEFYNAARKPWTLNQKIVGYVKQYQNLYKVAVNMAGHLSPMDQPEALYDMVTRFIENKPF